MFLGHVLVGIDVRKRLTRGNILEKVGGENIFDEKYV
jgi:hypothetical protein